MESIKDGNKLRFSKKFNHNKYNKECTISPYQIYLYVSINIVMQ